MGDACIHGYYYSVYIYPRSPPPTCSLLFFQAMEQEKSKHVSYAKYHIQMNASAK